MSLFFKPQLPPAVLALPHFSTFPSSCFYVYFSKSDTLSSEMKSAPWEPFQLLCVLVLFLCPFADVWPQDSWGCHFSRERGKCVLVTPAPLEITFPAPTPPEACQETDMNSVGSYEPFCRIPNQGAGT